MSKSSLTTSTLCALVPLTVLLAGCGGSATPSALLGDTGSAITQTIGSFTTRLVGAAQPPVFSQGSGGAVYGLAGASITDLSQSFAANLASTRFASVDSNGVIYLMNSDGSNKIPFTNENDQGNGGCAWSPGGSLLAFTDAGGTIVGARADGTGRFAITSGLNPSWSPDGTKIAYEGFNYNSSVWEIYSKNALNGTAPTRLTNNGPLRLSSYHAAWSPDGKKIAFDRGGNIYVINADGTNEQPLTNDGLSYEPAWSPDGGKIAFTYQKVGSPGAVISVMDVEGRSSTQLSTSSEVARACWSPDGKQVAYSRRTQIYVVNADGSNEHAIATGGYYGLSWSGFRTPKYVGTGGVLATDCAGFLLGKKGGNTFDTTGSSTGNDTNASVLIFDTPLAARSAARITANTNTDTPGPSLAFTITTSTGLSSVKFINTTQSLKPIAPIMPAGTTGALVLFSSTLGAVTDVVPYTANRSVGSTPKRVVSGDTATYTGSFPAIFDATGKNLAPSGAHSVTLNEKTGKLVHFE